MALAGLLATYLRNPSSWDNGVPTFSPPLTAAEQTTYDDLVAMLRTPLTASMTLAEYQQIKPFLATERSFVQMSQSEFIALTQNQRDRTLFDTLTAVIRVQRVMMRDG